MPVVITKKANEESTFIVSLEFFNESGEDLSPATLAWTLTDSDGTVMNGRTAVSAVVGHTINIVLSGDDLSLPSADTKRILYLNATYNSTYGTGLPLKEEVEFEIEPLVNVT